MAVAAQDRENPHQLVVYRCLSGSAACCWSASFRLRPVAGRRDPSCCSGWRCGQASSSGRTS